MKRLIILSAALFAISAAALCGQVRHEMVVPDIPGFVTLKGDMHIHTTFSDGTVWPTTRIDECVWEGLDVLCITDHVDGRLQKYTKDGTFNADKVDRNTSFKMMEKYARDKDVVVIHGGEITSQIMPPGHMNALFVTDNNPLGKAMDESYPDRQNMGADAAVRLARKQNAFVTWNHPNWCRQAPDTTVIYPIHEQYRKEGLINGVEIYNWWDGYCKEGHHWAVEHNLTLMSGTDSHHPMFMDIDFLVGELRPVTLIFATERSREGVREALDHQRTAVFAEGRVYGSADLLTPLLDACIRVEKVTKTKTKLTVSVYNQSSIPIVLDKAPGSEQWQISRHVTLHPFEHQVLTLYRLNTKDPLESDVFDLHYRVDNFFTDADVRLPWVLHIEKH